MPGCGSELGELSDKSGLIAKMRLRRGKAVRQKWFDSQMRLRRGKVVRQRWFDCQDVVEKRESCQTKMVSLTRRC